MKKFMTITAFALTIVATSALTSLVVTKNIDKLASKNDSTDVKTSSPVSFTTFSNDNTARPADFTYAAEKSVEAVVHVKTKIDVSNRYSMNIDPFFDFFFGRPSQPREPQYREGSGSGVIISTDGYIVTNNHVIDNATTVEVTLNDKRKFDAKVIGTDPSTDIALLKIEADNLPIISFGNSDNLRIGEWVLAVGNPFNLTSTVTAGIVSAKARNINILNAEMKIESFIQTDAAVNPGNSGGALVNTRGELIGINTAIASQTGSYTGYSFAVPISIVSKVVADLKEYSVVQRAVLGVQIADINNELAKEKNLTTLKGAYIVAVQENSSAADAGLKEGDIITTINNQIVNSVAELQEQISRYRPGNDIKINYIRDGKNQSIIVTLKNRSGNTNVVKIADTSILGATFKNVDKQIAEKFRLTTGIQIASIDKNGALAKAGLKKDFIILKVNGQPIRSEKDLTTIVNQTVNANDQERALFITGIFTNGQIAHFAVNLE
jgi:Do/DeqQ family serine protease